jgi:hypothetical protein
MGSKLPALCWIWGWEVFSVYLLLPLTQLFSAFPFKNKFSLLKKKYSYIDSPQKTKIYIVVEEFY